MRIDFPAAFALPVIPSAAFDDDLVRRCVALARRAAGQTRPNPPVGCVLTDAAGRTLGEGYHRRAGTPHAEVHALADAARRGHSTLGATAYVSLEPCNHFGRTPPCSEALVAAGVSRVVVGMVDPDPRTSGGGVARLRKAGITVDVGVGKRLCARAAEGFVSRVERKRPFGVLKWAMTLDGKIAAENGSSKWVTGDAARARVHAVRAQMDAIVVGGRTVREDAPRLTVRGVQRDGPLSPMRVVMTSSLALPLDSPLWDTRDADTIVFTQTLTGQDALLSHLARRGVDVVHDPFLTPDVVMRHLYDRDCLNVLWECGGALAARAIADGAVQKVMAFVAPKIIGGAHAPSPVGAPALRADMADALEMSERSVETFDNGDILISGYL